ncbi:hypothetical protein EZV62_022572 [Acer yangbiense]|uniref:RING-type E3 ubiquitin transferase n=1 Tax=Acer yangbiense TaxID=1000413 RepID=A0A5C7H8H2_9ROSI|nr:hypothetical protein EZV62_022572 [Acer yangbiense]
MNLVVIFDIICSSRDGISLIEFRVLECGGPERDLCMDEIRLNGFIINILHLEVAYSFIGMPSKWSLSMELSNVKGNNENDMYRILGKCSDSRDERRQGDIRGGREGEARLSNYPYHYNLDTNYYCRCSVCLGDYQAEDKLQQIPACGHAFHMDCIDHWLASHITCPLCRLSLLASAKAPSESPDTCQETSRESSVAENTDGTSDEPGLQACEETQAPESSVLNNGDARTLQNSCKEEERSSECSDQGGYSTDTSSEAEEPGLQACKETQASESSVLNNGDARTVQNSSKEEERSPDCSDQGGDSTDIISEAEEHEPSRGIPGNMHLLALAISRFIGVGGLSVAVFPSSFVELWTPSLSLLVQAFLSPFEILSMKSLDR